MDHRPVCQPYYIQTFVCSFAIHPKKKRRINHSIWWQQKCITAYNSYSFSSTRACGQVGPRGHGPWTSKNLKGEQRKEAGFGRDKKTQGQRGLVSGPSLPSHAPVWQWENEGRAEVIVPPFPLLERLRSICWSICWSTWCLLPVE